MKKIYTLLVALSLAATSFAQNGSLSFFSDKGEKFWVLLNGVAQNAKPQSNVKISNLAPSFYRVKVVFQIDTLGEITQNIGIQPGSEDVYMIKKRTTPKVFKKTKITDEINIDKYVIRPFSTSEFGGQQAPTTNQDVIVYGQGEELNTEEVVHPINTSTTVITTTTTQKKKTSTPNTTTNNGGVNFNLNVDPNNGNMNMNMNGTGVNVQTDQNSTNTTTQRTTTTQRSTTNQPANSTPARTTTVVRAMNSMDFQKAVEQIKKQTFEDSKMTVAKQVLKNNYMNCAQIKTIIGLFTYEAGKLDFAKAAYDKCVEKNNYYLLNDAFTYSASVDELNEFLESK